MNRTMRSLSLSLCPKPSHASASRHVRHARRDKPLAAASSRHARRHGPAGKQHDCLRAYTALLQHDCLRAYTALLPACIKTWTKRQARLAMEHHCRRALPSRARALALSRACACSLRHLPPAPAHSGALPDSRGRWLVVVRIWIAQTFSTSAAPI